MENHWEFIQENETQLKRVCARSCAGNVETTSDMFSDCVVMKAKRVISRYDPNHESGASLLTFFITNLRWEILKWHNKKMKTNGRVFYVGLPNDNTEGDNKLNNIFANESNEEYLQEKNHHSNENLVREVLDKLSPRYKQVLFLYHIKQMTFEQIAPLMRVADKTSVRLIYHKALSVAQGVANGIGRQ